MDKAKRKGNADTTHRLKDEVEKATGSRGDELTQELHIGVWVREDGAVCFGDECVVVKPEGVNNALSIEIDPSSCGSVAGEAIVEHLIKTIGRGGETNFKVKSQLKDESQKKS